MRQDLITCPTTAPHEPLGAHLHLHYNLHLVGPTCFLLKTTDGWEDGKAKSLQLFPTPHFVLPARPMVSILPSKVNPAR